MEQHLREGELAQDAAAQSRRTHQYVETFLRCSARYLGLPWPVVRQVERAVGTVPDAE